jgi:hypothetical protein
MEGAAYIAMISNAKSVLYREHTIMPVELFHNSALQRFVSVSRRVRVRSPNESTEKARKPALRMADIFGGEGIGA